MNHEGMYTLQYQSYANDAERVTFPTAYDQTPPFAESKFIVRWT